MEQSNLTKPRIRKRYASEGSRSQKMVNFRCDLENVEWLEQQPNKGRSINEAIREKREKEVGR